VISGRLLPLAAAAVVMLAGCAADEGSGDNGGPASAQGPAETRSSPSTAAPAQPPEVKPYEPEATEEFPNGKRLAGRIAQRALTYATGSTAREVAAGIGPAAVSRAHLARAIRPAVDRSAASAGKVVYPQLSGVTDTSLGAMVVMRQTLVTSDGETREITRVLDVRLRRSGGPWSLDRIASVGGTPAARPASLAPAAARVLDHPDITLPDSARWDINRGAVDTSLLNAVLRAAREHELSIAVLRSGHPHNVWETTRPSAHSAGFAVDIWAVAGRPVIEQREPRTPAYEVAEDLYAGGAGQLGSPWVFDKGGVRSFTDAVHQDHIHLQQAPLASG
jgi:hypothetical protein